MLTTLFVGLFFVDPVFATIAGVPLLIIMLIVLPILSSTLNSIFTLAIFVYAKTGEVPQGFSKGVITGAVNVVEK